MSFTLPLGFGYVLNEMGFFIEVDTASDWESTMMMRISRASPQLGLFDYLEVIAFNLGGRNGVSNNTRSAAPISSQLPRTPIIIDSTAVHGLTATNLQAAVGAVGTFNAMISFWEYDLEQIQYFPVHAPVGVYSR